MLNTHFEKVQARVQTFELGSFAVVKIENSSEM